MKFSYEAYSKSGALKTGSIEAGTKEEATDQLRKKGLFVTSIHEGGAGGAAIAGSGPKKKRRSSKVSVRLFAEFARVKFVDVQGREARRLIEGHWDLWFSFD